jgi:hypothetical protein
MNFSTGRESNRSVSPPLPTDDPAEAEPQILRRRYAATPIVSAIALAGVVCLFVWQIIFPNANATVSGSTGFDLLNCSPTSERCFDTGWQPVSNKTSSIYFYRHRLGATPRIISAWFSPTAEGREAYSLAQSFPGPSVGNPITLEARPDMVLIHTWKGAPIHGVYDGKTEKWTTYAEGFYRIVAIK